MKTKNGLLSLALATLFLGLPLASSSAFVAVSIGIAPPAIPIYTQPLCPAPGYIWVPGYWAYGDVGYYWVPGEWVFPPRVGLLWTPGYWSYSGTTYIFNEGYWGPSVGFYGGINYGYGYYGRGYYGGRWVSDTFRYNTAVSRVNTQVIQDTYVDRAFARNAHGTRASFNGPGGVRAKANAKELVAASAEHVGPTSSQQSRVTAAASDPALHAGNNKEKPKSTAVKTFESKHGPDVAGTAAAAGFQQAATKNGAAEQTRAEKSANATGQDRTENRAGTTKQARAGKANERVANNNAARSRSSVKTARNNHVESSQTRQATHARHNKSRGTVSAPRSVRHTPTAPHRAQAAGHGPQGAKHRQAAGNGGKKKGGNG